jgi:hypothetical protein
MIKGNEKEKHYRRQLHVYSCFVHYQAICLNVTADLIREWSGPLSDTILSPASERAIESLTKGTIKAVFEEGTGKQQH